MKVVLFGGSFDPVHIGHVFAACHLRDNFDKVIVVPSYKHPFDKEMEKFEHRLTMCEKAFGWMPNVYTRDIEKKIYNGESNYMADTAEALKKELEKAGFTSPGWPSLRWPSLHFMIGADAYHDLQNGKWKHKERLLKLAAPYVMARVGYRGDDLGLVNMLPDISSTYIRELLKNKTDYWYYSQVIPSEVLQYIEENNLYE